jgi:quercetin dioxygenase-like cupin family protein
VNGFVKKSFRTPEETAQFPKAKVETVTISGVQVRRLICEPGWVWSKSVGAQMGRESCPLDHAIWVVTSGRFAVEMEDGTTEEFGPGDIGSIPPDHDAWVVGDETVIGIDILAESLEKKGN